MLVGGGVGSNGIKLDKLGFVRPIPHRNAVSPPQLAADAPILNVFHPVKIGFVEAFRHDFGATFAHSGDGGRGQRLGFDKPLSADQRLDNRVAAFATPDLHQMRLGFRQIARVRQIGHHLFPRREAIQTSILPAFGADMTVGGQHIDHRQIMAQANFVIVRIVAGRDFERTRAKFAFHIRIGNNRNAPPQRGQNHRLPNQFGVAFVIGMHRDCRICQHSFGARRGNRNRAITVGDPPIGVVFVAGNFVANVPQIALFGFVAIHHFQIRNRRLTARTPIDQARATIN